MPRLLSLVLACLAVGLLVATTAAATPKPGTAKVGKGGHATGPAPAAGVVTAPPGKAHDLRDTGAPAGKLESGPSWIDGAADYDWTSDCITGPAILGNSWVGWYGEIGSSPVVNDVYYIHVVWGVTADPCSGGAYTHIEIALPSFTQLAISSGNPVFCYYQSPSAATASRFTSGCPQGPTGVGMYGGLSFDPTSGSAAWPTAFGAIFELQIPVKTSKPLDGLILGGGNGCPACLYSGTWMIDGVFSPWLFPVQGVYVKQGAPPAVPPPYVDYPVPNHYQDGSTATQWWTAGFAFTEGTSGTIYSYLREGTSGTFVQAPGVGVSAGSWRIDQPWNPLQAGHTYQFKVCYDPSGAAPATCGALQTFKVPGGADLTPPNTSITKKPPTFTNKTSATFNFDSTELGSSFFCTRDGLGEEPCTAPTYQGLTAGTHTLSVRARDAANNYDATPATYTWHVDLTPPETTINSVTKSGRTVTAKFASNEAGSFLCRLDSKAWVKCSSPKAFLNVTNGSHTIRVQAVDRAGNKDLTPASKAVHIP